MRREDPIPTPQENVVKTIHKKIEEKKKNKERESDAMPLGI